MDVPYGLNRLKDPLQPHWDDEPFPPDQVVEAIRQLRHNNQNAKMVVILFGEHSIIGDYAKAIKADDDSVDISFGAMTIRYNYKSPQAWMTNNWESYLIIRFGSINEVVFHRSPELPSFLSFSSKPPVVIKSGDHPVNYAVKPVDAMRRFIKTFSNPGDTVIDAFAGTHTTSIAALLENRNAIAIEADQSQWLSAQHHVKEVVNSMLDHMPISSSPSTRRKSSEKKKPTSAFQPSPLAPVRSPQLISTPSPAFLDTSMDEFFLQLPQPPSTSTVPSSNQVVCIICKQPAEKEEDMEICSDVSCMAHAHHACGQFDNGRFVCSSLHKPTNVPE
jgi:hypothetical protein